MNETAEAIARAIIIIVIGLVVMAGLLFWATRPTCLIAIGGQCVLYYQR